MKKSTERWMSNAILLILGFNVIGVAFILVSNAVHEHRYHRDLLATDGLALRFEGPENIELQEPHAYVRNEGLLVNGCLNSTETFYESPL